MSVVVVDSGVANLTSVIAALRRLGVQAEVTSDPHLIRTSTHVILPGVGTASAAMQQLKAKKLVNVIQSLTQPVLGICLGMQLLFTRSEENQGVACLNIIQGQIKQLVPEEKKPIPHMGWNQIKITSEAHPLLKNMPDHSFVYFVHSFAAPLSSYGLASCEYTEPFTAIVGFKNFFGCQFHPERSGLVGHQILKNFTDM